MEILSLPFPALQIIIEHMVVAAGIYRATRLRLVCSMGHRTIEVYPDVSNADRFFTELFDDEVIRAIFGTRILDVDADLRLALNRSGTISYLKGRTMRTHVFTPTAFTSTIRTAAELLLEDTQSDENVSQQRILYQEALCNAVVDTMPSTMIKRRVKEHPGVPADQLNMPSHMLAAAAAVGNIALVQSVLSTSPGISIKSTFFGCALTNAARIGRDDIVSLLLVTFDNYSKTEDFADRTTTAAFAPGYQHKPIAKALAVACEHGYETIVQTLSRHTNQFEQFTDSAIVDALDAAAYNGHIGLVQSLLETASFSRKDEVLSQLMLASCRGGHIELVERLVSSGADINAYRVDGHSGLCMAAERGHLGVVKFLMDRGVEWRDRPRGDALCLAAMCGHEDVVQLFLDSKIYYGGQETLELALVRAAHHGETRMVRFLVQKGVNLDKPGVGHHAIQWAAEQGYDDTVRFLAEQGVSVSDCELTGEPMLFALAYGQKHVVKLLLELGATPIDPLKSRFAFEFECGEYPQRPLPL